MSLVTLIGFTAGVLVTGAAVPQVIKIWKTRQTHAISLLMYIALTMGIFLWVVYGILIDDLPITLANGISFIFISSILVFKIKYK